jgi:DNA-binding NarL/FixJ family response regulator
MTEKSSRNEAIRKLVDAGEPLKEVAAQFNISVQRVSAIAKAAPSKIHYDSAIERPQHSIVSTVELLIKQSQELQSKALELLGGVDGHC